MTTATVTTADIKFLHLPGFLDFVTAKGFKRSTRLTAPGNYSITKDRYQICIGPATRLVITKGYDGYRVTRKGDLGDLHLWTHADPKTVLEVITDSLLAYRDQWLPQI